MFKMGCDRDKKAYRDCNLDWQFVIPSDRDSGEGEREGGKWEGREGGKIEAGRDRTKDRGEKGGCFEEKDKNQDF